MRALLILLLAQDALAAAARPVVARVRPSAPVAAAKVVPALPTLGLMAAVPVPSVSAPLEAPAALGAPFDGAKLAKPGDAVEGSLSTPPSLPPSVAQAGAPRPEPPRPPRRLRRWKRWVAGLVAGTALLAGAAAWYLKPGAAPLEPTTPVVVIGQSAYDLVPALSGHRSAVVSVAEHAGKRVTVDEDGLWLVTDLASGLVYKPRSYPGKAKAAAFRGGSLLLLDQDGTVRVDGRSVSPNAGKVEQFAFSPARDVAALTNGSNLHVLDVAAAQSRGFLMEGRILALAAADGEVRLATLRGSLLRLWSVKPGAAPVVVREKLLPGVTVGVTVMSADGGRMAASGGLGDDKGVIALGWGGKIQMAAAAKFDPALEVAALAVDGDQVAVLGADGRLWLWWPDDGDVEPLGRLGPGARIVFGADGVLYSSDSSGAVRAWPSK